jgi:hypothetical protein
MYLLPPFPSNPAAKLLPARHRAALASAGRLSRLALLLLLLLLNLQNLFPFTSFTFWTYFSLIEPEQLESLIIGI